MVQKRAKNLYVFDFDGALSESKRHWITEGPEGTE